jgi:tetratricopeptide (TPR) repeat protein
MKNSTIEELAYLIKEADKARLPQPIVFLGAGASKSGGIPLAGEIVTDILDRFKDNPSIRVLAGEERTYPNLMECLAPFQRNQLLKEYIDKARINVTHIYLAQLLKAGYIDYVLTVNFDNLMLRALALYNEFPPTYDLAILKDLTTTSFQQGSILYLHGQHRGLWLLNTPEELAKVKEFIPPILNKITNQRPWIFIGYSGDDPIFDHVVNLGRFDNGLYWVCYKEGTPDSRVCDDLLNKPNTNSFILKGYDSDSFMLKLNEELGLGQPEIIDKPFTSLKNSLENIVDINNEKHFNGVKERLKIVKNQVNSAIKQFEEGVIEPGRDREKETEINRLRKDIINEIIKEEFDEAKILKLVMAAEKLDDEQLNESAANLFVSWGNKIFDLAKVNENVDLYWQSIEKFERAIELNPKNDSAFNNWGASLLNIAKLSANADLYKQCIKKSERAFELNSKNSMSLYNWGTALANLAKIASDENLYNQGLEKFKQSTDLDPTYEPTFYNWGNALSDLAKLKGDNDLYNQAIEKHVKAVELGADTYNLACAYALIGNKEFALKNLENSLSKSEVTVEFIEKDSDWNSFFDNPNFTALLDQYRK